MINILITGARGFVGQRLSKALEMLKEESDCQNRINKIFRCNRETSEEEMEYYCASADIVFHLAGVLRPKNSKDYLIQNVDFTRSMVDKLYRSGCKARVIFASSIQARLTGRFTNTEYGKSKLEGENIVRQYNEYAGTMGYIYRLPNLFGEGGKPNYNSVVATFCDAVAKGKRYVINDAKAQLELCYVGDLIEEFLLAIKGKEHRQTKKSIDEHNKLVHAQELKILCDEIGFCYVPYTYVVTLDYIVECLDRFHNHGMIDVQYHDGTFERKLYNTYCSYVDI